MNKWLTKIKHRLPEQWNHTSLKLHKVHKIDETTQRESNTLITCFSQKVHTQLRGQKYIKIQTNKQTIKETKGHIIQ